MAIRSVSPFSIERLVERMRVGARRQALSASTAGGDIYQGESPATLSDREVAPGSAFSNFTRPRAEPLVLQPSFEPHPDDRYHVNDLLPYHDRTFIQNAYRAILKRGPDATGYNSFIESLRSGRLNKIDILARLRYSTEGRAKKVRIDGLLFPGMIRLAYRVPVVGYLLNLAVAVVRLPKSIRHQQQFEAHLLAQQDQIVDYANHGNAVLGRLAVDMSAALARLQQSAEEFAEQQRQQAESLARDQKQNLEAFTGEQRQRMESSARDHQQQLESLERARQQQIESLARGHQKSLESFANEQQVALARAHAELERLQKLADGQGQETESIRLQLREETGRLENSLEQKSAAGQTRVEVLGKELRAELARILARHQEVRSEQIMQAQRANVLLESVREQLSGSPSQDSLQAIAQEASHTLDAFYLALEEQFRGSRDEIKQRLRVYLPLITNVGLGTEQAPILDVGCGRGEWLELLREKGLRARGIDSNRMQVTQCLELGLEVAEAELLDYLRSLPGSSLGAVTGFHIVEHLPIETLVAFLDETVRVVKPGGAVIFETPNPENVLVGSCNFYFDPTHRNPLPSPVLQFLLESRGFQRVQVLTLNPSDEAPVKGNTELAKRFNQYFYGPMDYAVLGWRA